MLLFATRLATLAALFLLFTQALSRNISELPLNECDVICYERSCSSTTALPCVCSKDGVNQIAECLTTTCRNATDYYTGLRKLYYDCDVPQPVFTKDPDYIPAAIIVFIIQTTFFGLRITARLLKLGKWGLDDTTCVAAYVILFAQLVICILEGYYGYYNNYWTLDLWKLPPFLKLDFARAQLYAIGLGLSKMSIIFLYQRIFEGPRLRWVLLGTQTFNALLTLSYFLAAFWVARPFGCMFEVDQASDCTYNDVWDGTGAFSAVNAAFDVWLVAIPAAVVWRLQMKTERRINVIAVFATGILTCFVAIARFVLVRLSSRSDQSQRQYQTYIWLVYYAYYAELTSCFIICCLPAIRQLVGKKVWPVLKTRWSALSFTLAYRSRSARSVGYLDSNETRTISSPVEGSFEHLTSDLYGEEYNRWGPETSRGYPL